MARAASSSSLRQQDLLDHGKDGPECVRAAACVQSLRRLMQLPPGVAPGRGGGCFSRRLVQHQLQLRGIERLTALAEELAQH